MRENKADENSDARKGTYRVEAGREGRRPGREARFLVCAAICEHCVHPGGQVPLTTCAAWALIWQPLQ